MEEKTGYEIFTSKNDNVVEITIKGKITELDIPRLQKEFKSHREAGCYRILIDIRALSESVDPGVLYYVRRPERAMGKTAVVDISENEQYKLFWENLAKHTTMELKWFCNIDDARTWLKCSQRSRALFVDRLFNDLKQRDSSMNAEINEPSNTSDI